MAGEGVFPKVNGDVLYASEVNSAIGFPKIIASGANDLTFGVTNGSNYIMITANGVMRAIGGGGAGFTTASANLYLDNTSVDGVISRQWDGGPTGNYEDIPFSLIFNTFLISGTSNHAIGISGANSLVSSKIIVTELGKKY